MNVTDKIIIENRSDLNISECLLMISKVISMGKVSNFGKDYALLTPFNLGDDILLLRVYFA